jgi:hypothetical protein
MENPKQLIYSPVEHIPIGEPVILPNGGHGICFKRKRKTGDVTEVVPLDKLHELVMQGNIKTSEQRSQ